MSASDAFIDLALFCPMGFALSEHSSRLAQNPNLSGWDEKLQNVKHDKMAAALVNHLNCAENAIGSRG